MLAAQFAHAEYHYWSAAHDPETGAAEFAGLQVSWVTPRGARECVASFRLILARKWLNEMTFAKQTPTVEPRCFDGLVAEEEVLGVDKSRWKLRVSWYDHLYDAPPPSDLELLGPRLGAPFVCLSFKDYAEADRRTVGLCRAEDIAEYTKRLTPFTSHSVTWLQGPKRTSLTPLTPPSASGGAHPLTTTTTTTTASSSSAAAAAPAASKDENLPDDAATDATNDDDAHAGDGTPAGGDDPVVSYFLGGPTGPGLTPATSQQTS